MDTVDRGSYARKYLSNHVTIFSALDIDYCYEISTFQQKSLMERCMDAILSDIYILRRIVEKIPNALQVKLMDRALETSRILSVKFLLERYPNEEFVLPIPEPFKNYSIMVEKRPELPVLTSLRNMKDNIDTIAVAFQNVILEKEAHSNLHILNFNKLPQVTSILKHICSSFKEDRSYKKQYIIKGSFMFADESDYIDFKEASELCSPNLVINLTGIYAPLIHVPKQLVDLLSKVNSQDLQYLAIDLVLENLPLFLPSMQKFKNLTTLSITYINGLTATLLDDLAQVIYKLPELKILRLRSLKLSNTLGTLLMKNCRMQDMPQSKKRKTDEYSCCVVHRDKLQFLDVSYCRLTNRDLECLKECKNLRHLHLGDNISIQTEKLADCLDSMASNLVVLDVHNVMDSSRNVQLFTEMLDKFVSLKFLILGHIFVSEDQFHTLIEALLNIPCLKEVQIMPRRRYSPGESVFHSMNSSILRAKTLMKQKGVQVYWTPFKK